MLGRFRTVQMQVWSNKRVCLEMEYPQRFTKIKNPWFINVYHHWGESKILEQNQMCVCSGVMVLSFATSIDESFARS